MLAKGKYYYIELKNKSRNWKCEMLLFYYLAFFSSFLDTSFHTLIFMFSYLD